VLGKAGVICQIANVEELSSAYIELLTNEEAWYKAQKVALERVNTFYTQEIFLNNYRDVYKKTFEELEE